MMKLSYTGDASVVVVPNMTPGNVPAGKVSLFAPVRAVASADGC